MSGKRYSNEFKIKAAKQVVKHGHGVTDLVSRLGITAHGLYAWIKKFCPYSAEYTAAAAEQAEIKRLKKELKCTVGWSMQPRAARNRVLENMVPADVVC